MLSAVPVSVFVEMALNLLGGRFNLWHCHFLLTRRPSRRVHTLYCAGIIVAVKQCSPERLPNHERAVRRVMEILSAEGAGHDGVRLEAECAGEVADQVTPGLRIVLAASVAT